MSSVKGGWVSVTALPKLFHSESAAISSVGGSALFRWPVLLRSQSLV